MLALAMLLGCPKQAPEPTVEATAFDRSVRPSPLARQDFILPTTTTATLSNGVPVFVVENHELPFVDLRVVFRAGSFTDPEGLEGLASASADMWNEGTEARSGTELSTELRKLGSSVGSSAGLDQASVSASSLKRNLEPTLDLWAEVLLAPTFPAEEWERIQAQGMQDIQASRTNPQSTAWRVMDRQLYGDAYDGRFRTQESLAAIDVEGMKAWRETHVVPANAAIFASGDITVDELVPLLEARLADWQGGEVTQVPEITALQPEESQLFLVDKPGAAQSVVTAARFVGERTDAHADALTVGNTAWGGMFMARLNMNLREDKGWTYGARSGFSDSHAARVWYAQSSIVSDSTAPAVAEMISELAAIGGDRPLTVEEVDYMKSSLLNGYPGRFETAGYLIGQKVDVWHYDLPADYLDTYTARIDGVGAEAAQAAFQEHVASQPLIWVVVGDVETIRGPLEEATGLTAVLLDAEAQPLEGE
jgi:zinc protease